MKIGVTGHQELDDKSAWLWVREEVDALLSNVESPLIGLSSLATGADQLFAEVIIEHGGQLEAIIPFPGYERTFGEKNSLLKFNQLKLRASRVETLPARRSDQEGYFAAGERIVALSNKMVAVWNGRPARGFGGTADIVRVALHAGKPTWHLNPTDRTKRLLTSETLCGGHWS